jgi:hypothetical protein
MLRAGCVSWRARSREGRVAATPFGPRVNRADCRGNERYGNESGGLAGGLSLGNEIDVAV